MANFPNNKKFLWKIDDISSPIVLDSVHCSITMSEDWKAFIDGFVEFQRFSKKAYAKGHSLLQVGLIQRQAGMCYAIADATDLNNPIFVSCNVAFACGLLKLMGDCILKEGIPPPFKGPERQPSVRDNEQLTVADINLLREAYEEISSDEAFNSPPHGTPVNFIAMPRADSVALAAAVSSLVAALPPEATAQPPQHATSTIVSTQSINFACQPFPLVQLNQSDVANSLPTVENQQQQQQIGVINTQQLNEQQQYNLQQIQIIKNNNEQNEVNCTLTKL